MADFNAGRGDKLAQACGHGVNRLDTIMEVEDLPAAVEFARYGPFDKVFIVGAHKGLDGEAIGGRGFDDAEIACSH